MVRSSRLVLLFGILTIADPLGAQVTARGELGFGFRLGGISAGPSMRLAGGVSVGRWGGLARIVLSSGAQTSERGLFGPRKEGIDELAFLVTRGFDPVTPHRLSMGLGLGSIAGWRQAVRTVTGGEDIPRSLGLAFGVGMELGDGRGTGWGFSMFGNVNREAGYLSFGFFLSLAHGW